MFIAGDIHLLSPTSTLATESLIGEGTILTQRPSPVHTYLLFGSRVLAFRSAAIRRSIQRALDDDALDQAARGWAGAINRTTQFARPSEATLSMGTRRPVQLHFSSFAPNEAIAEAISDALRKQLGLRIELAETSYEDLRSRHVTSRFDLMLAHIAPHFNHPSGVRRPLIADAHAAGLIGRDTVVELLRAVRELSEDQIDRLWEEAGLPKPLLRLRETTNSLPQVRGLSYFSDNSLNLNNVSIIEESSIDFKTVARIQS